MDCLETHDSRGLIAGDADGESSFGWDALWRAFYQTPVQRTLQCMSNATFQAKCESAYRDVFDSYQGDVLSVYSMA
jgi:hypothetical protein